MRTTHLIVAVLVLLGLASTGLASSITGEYLEARTCDVYTGPCFANSEMGLSGKEAIMAWQVDQGSWNNVSLDGLGVAVILNAQGTLGYDGVFPMRAGEIHSIILVDDKATAKQRDALIAFAKDSAQDLTKNVVKVEIVPLSLKNDHLSGQAHFKAGQLAEIKTRALLKGDCVCSNEVVYYLPLTKVENFHPAFSLKLSYQGNGLRCRWTSFSQRGAFLATFSR